MLRIAAIGAGIGAGIDALIRKRVTISDRGSTALHAAPIIAPGTGGVQLALIF